MSIAIRPSRLAALGLAAVLALPGLASADARLDGPYIDAATYARGDDARVEAWYAMTYQLPRQFDQICGDTFCEGEYTNLQPLRFECSVHRDDGRIGMCVWSFAASEEFLVARTGRIIVQPKVWHCRTPLAAGTTLPAMLDAVAGGDALDAVLPGGRSIFDGLVDCL
ncbi:hypothetical protein [Luteimonas sp. RC10]|uniref:hypothetical protein n=1 Tax=Luteimonas sp. RC10 TaxID=2587035 RepID=UPI001617F92C|nr:hypothetical protein [Luteimonas sp. RC10]MBB3344340.1 hypothetical protein [Luteimonas sp. RC10]